MNRAILIILIPALLVAVGYILVLRSMGLAPAYLRLVAPVALLFGALYWFSRRTARNTDAKR
jgi:hypothetical protein